MTTHTTSSAPTPGVSELQAWRTNALNYVLAAVAIAAPPAMGAVVLDAIQIPQQQPAAIAFAICYVLVVVMAIFHRLDARLRAWGLLLVGYAAGTLAFMRGGLAGDGRVYIIGLPVIAFILVGVRTGFATTALSVLIYAAFGWFAHSGQMASWLLERFQANPLAARDWFQGGLNVVMILVPVAVLLWRLLRFHEKTLEMEHKTTQDLIHTSNLLHAQAKQVQDANRALAERAKSLTTASEVARRITSLTNEKDLTEQFLALVTERFDLYHAGLFAPEAGTGRVVLSAASSEPGRRLAQQNYRLPAGSPDPASRAAQSKTRVLAPVPAGDAWPDLPLSQWRLALPLLAGGELEGVLDIHFRQARQPSPEQVTILEILADQLTVGLQNARLFARMQANLQELTRLYQSMTAEAWQEFAAAKPEWRRYQTGSVQLPEAEWTDLFAQARQRGQPASRPSQQTDASRQLLAVPIKLRNIPIGVIGFHRPADTGEWRTEEVALAEQVAERAAIALDNVRLIEETRRRAARERAIRESADRMQQAVDMESLVRITAQEVQRILGGSRTFVRLTGGAEGDQDAQSH